MNRLALAVLLTLVAWLAVMPADVRGCGGAFRPGERVDVADETALIIWDATTKTQHFIRHATFVGSAYDFGFLVPTPNRPQLEPADPNLFTELAKITEPKTETRSGLPNLGCGGSPGRTGDDLHARLPGGVIVLEEKRVGDLDAAVLTFRGTPGQKPEDAAADLLTWLNNHQYAVRPDLTDWLVPYIRDKWIITAFKIAGQPTGTRALPNDTSKGVALKASAVRMSFKTERPFFPYREPADQRDTQATGVQRLLRVYVAAKQRMAGKLGDGSSPWPGKTVWANAVTDSERGSLLGKVKLPAETASGGWWLTEFEDRSSPRPGTDEVYFEASGDQTIVARQPNIQIVDPWWLGPLCIAIPVGLFAVVLWLVRRRWRSAV